MSAVAATATPTDTRTHTHERAESGLSDSCCVLQDYLRKHPDCEVYTGQDETLDMKAIREQVGRVATQPLHSRSCPQRPALGKTVL